MFKPRPARPLHPRRAGFAAAAAVSLRNRRIAITDSLGLSYRGAHFALATAGRRVKGAES